MIKMSIKRETSAGVVLFFRGDRILYLLLKYRWGHWGFIKGHIEPGEDEIETIKRETKEETGITDIKFIPGFREKIEYTYTMHGEKRHKTVYYRLAETTQINVKLSHEHVAYAWLPYEEAIKRITYDNDRNVLRKAHEYLKRLGIIKEE